MCYIFSGLISRTTFFSPIIRMTGSTDFNIKSLGPCRIPSPLKLELKDGTPYFNFVSDEIEKLNQKFSNPEQIKKFSILPRDFSIDEGELTPTLKIRRKQINDNWSKVINAMYSEK